jgi:hypothetical protein
MGGSTGRPPISLELVLKRPAHFYKGTLLLSLRVIQRSLSRSWRFPTARVLSGKCNSSAASCGIGTVDGGARGLHTDHAASRRLSRASLIGSIFLVSVVSVFPAYHCDSREFTAFVIKAIHLLMQFTAFVIWRARTITKVGKLFSPHFSADIHSHSVNTITTVALLSYPSRLSS